MTRGTNRRGSVLIMALWIIAVLSVMVVSFAFEARQQAGIDIYVRERNRVNRMVDTGRMIGEAVLVDYENVKDPEIKNGEPDWKDAFEDDGGGGDRWCVEKYALKTDHKVVIGPIRMDDEETEEEGEETDAGTITVEIKFESATSKVDINSLCEDKDKNYADRWQTILRQSGIDDELEVEVEDANRSGKKKHNLMNLLVASWVDWRDEDDTVSKGPLPDDSDYRHDPQEDDGAEKEWYEERDEEDEIPIKDRRVPANGPIKKLEELSYIRGFRDFPAVLTGGLLYPDKEESEENPRLQGIMDKFKVTGGSKMELNDETTAEDLSTIPGLTAADASDAREQEDCEALVQAILGALKTPPEDDDDIDETRTWWPYKDMEDLKKRIEDYDSSVEMSANAEDGLKEYINFQGSGTSGTNSGGKGKDSEDTQYFMMTITGESLGMKYTVKARCKIADKKVVYIEWSENETVK